MSKSIVTLELLQGLSSSEAVVQLFQTLGYQTRSNFALPVNQLFQTPEQQIHIKRVWAIAQYQPLLYVYLLEVDSLSNTLIKQLCRVMARRQGNYLLVFTEDYSELAFVNLVRSTSQEAGRGIELRRLDIDRSNPTPKALRILRRIAVVDAQVPTPLLAVKLYKKQCEALELTKWRHDEFNNRSLFSDYYLKERLPDEPSLYPEWQQDITSVYQKARRLYQSLDFDALQRDEAATREKWVRPILHLLGHSNIEQSKDDAHPTFRLFSDVDYDSKRASPVLCHVKAWGHNLDHYGQQEPQELEQPLNPSFQIIRFLSEYRADWGILTNGREWRLYYTKAHATASNYYEIDLAELLESNDVESFRYFYHFFCCEAFLSQAERKSFLERVYDGSQDYAIKLAERIKDLVFERIFPSLAEGFVAYRRLEKKVTQEADDSLKLIFASSLTLLYRLLFLLYAEDRDLLPVGEQYGYRRYSLKALKEDVAKALDANQTYSRTTYRLWNELESLFNVIAKGDRDLNVPTYNGGLFSGDNPRNAFLAEHKIADYWLATVLDLLTREVDPDTGRKGFIDYKSLGVNQLGSIYEGLLEFHLGIADEELIVIRQKGKEVYNPIGELPKRAKILRSVSEGEIYLENDKRERKATGSYYTPDYIVKYIVENTVGPVLEEKFSKVEELFTAKVDATATEHPAVTELFSLKVLDPAMGSGHFLVEAVDFITEGMIAFLARHPTNPVLGELERIRATIREEMESQGVMIDDSQLTGENLLKRRVMKSCIYGVDLNDMAVELSKLSLWLDAFTLGAPLSFLDHHLKCGNSLIGVTDIREYIIPNTSRYQDFLEAVGELVHVSQLTDATMTEVDESKTLYDQAKERLRPTIERANVEVAKYFTDISERGLTNAAKWAYVPVDKRVATDSYSRLELNNFNTVQQVAQDKHFFHWALEFPEVFYTPAREKESPGFDVVIGNPPYANVEDLPTAEKSWLEFRDASFFNNKNDLLYHIVVRALENTKVTGLVSMIISRYLTEAHYANKFRNFFARHFALLSWSDFGNLELFRGINTRCVIFRASRDAAQIGEIQVTQVQEWMDSHNLLFQELSLGRAKRYSGLRTFRMTQKSLPQTGPWVFVDESERAMQMKIESVSACLGGDSGLCKIGMGWNTGLDKAFMLTKEQVETFAEEKEYIRPLIKNGDIKRFELSPPRFYWINTNNIDFTKAPNIADYLCNQRSELENRYAVRKGGKAWYEFAVVNMPEVFTSDEKIVVPFKAPENRFALDTSGALSSQDVYAMRLYDNSLYSHYYIIGVLNSHPMTFWYQIYYGRRKKAEFDYYSSLLKAVPIRIIHSTTPKDKRKSQVVDLIKLYRGNDFGTLLRKVDSFLPKDIDGNFLAFQDGYGWKYDPETKTGIGSCPEQSDVVHDFLAYLAEQMIEMNKEKQAEVSKYLESLESTIDTPVHDLTGKTTLQSYYNHSWGEILKVLIKNKSKLSINPTLPFMQNMLEDEYRKSMNVLEPLMKRITATDDLIDQIVYRLYGLTEEEIRIVDESTK